MKSDYENILEIIDIKKSFPGVQALSNISFNVKRNNIHGIVGENGAGKSTLIKILAGAYKPDSGIIKFDGKILQFDNPKESLGAGITTMYQELSVMDDLTVAQDLFFGEEQRFSKFGFINYKLMNNEAKNVLKNLGFNIDVYKKVNALSFSDKKQLEIGKAVRKNSTIILMDEPTAALSENEIENLFMIIKNLHKKNISIVYISHHLDEVFQICDKVTILRDGKVIDTLDVENNQKFRNTIVSKMIGENLANKKTNRNRKIISSEIVLEVKNYSTDNGVNDVSFKLYHGEILGIYGTLGSKRSELFKSIFTGFNKTNGQVLIRNEIIEKSSIRKSISKGLGFSPENRAEEGLFLNLRISENIPFILYEKESKLGFMKRITGVNSTINLVKALNIKTPSINQFVQNLSGGNQQKVVVAKLLAAKLEILILDEPLTGIDIGAKNELLNLTNNLTNEGKSIILISSELPELIKISDRILIMRKGKIIKEITENFNQEEIIKYAVGAYENE